MDGKTLRSIRKSSGMTLSRFAASLGLRHRSSLMQYETGSKPLSQKVIARLDELLYGSREVTIEAKILIPSGTILPDTAEIVVCEGCNRKFIRMHKRQRFHHRNCQARTWRRKERNNGRQRSTSRA